jgi:hypothetical protein
MLTKMAKQAKAALQREELHIIADRGYFSGVEILACHKAGITATVPRSDTSGARSKGRFVKADFAYEHENDVYRCPTGQALTYRTTTEQQGCRCGTTGQTPARLARSRNIAPQDMGGGSQDGNMNIMSKPRMRAAVARPPR